MNMIFARDATQAKKGRKSTPKVRSGCFTCKSRRVKCDEQKPECQRCLRASRTCEGYPEPTRGGPAQSLPLEPASIATYSIPFKVPGSQVDRQLLHYYCSQAAWNLSSCADPTLWTELILQRANHQPVVRNALVALSALHKDYLCGELVNVGNGLRVPAAHSGMAPAVANIKTMGMISRCHRQLRNYLSRVDASPDVALVCSVIFHTFESLLGESQRAIWHLDQGLILLRKCQLDNPFDPSDPLMPHLSTLLYHLDLQASCFDDRRPPILKLASEAETKGHVNAVPDVFLDLAHAEAVLTKLQNWVLHHLLNCTQSRREAPAEGELADRLCSELFAEKLVLAGQLQRFEIVLDRFASHESLALQHATITQIRHEDRRQQRIHRLLVLRITLHTFAYLIKENIPVFNPNSHGSAREGFESLPGSNARVMANRNAESDLEASLAAIEALLFLFQSEPTSAAATATSSPRTYTLCTHLPAALYFLALKTTNKQLVARAISLFSHPQLRNTRDGLWDTRTAAFLVENLVKVRQSGTVTVTRGNPHHGRGSSSDICMHVAQRDMTAELVELQHLFEMRRERGRARGSGIGLGLGLPMMQSKTFTLVVDVDRDKDGSEWTPEAVARAKLPLPRRSFPPASTEPGCDAGEADGQRSLLRPSQVEPAAAQGSNWRHSGYSIAA